MKLANHPTVKAYKENLVPLIKSNTVHFGISYFSVFVQ